MFRLVVVVVGVPGVSFLFTRARTGRRTVESETADCVNWW